MAVLGDLEHRIMEVLWNADGPMSVRDVHDVLLADGKIAYTTVMTVLDRLAKKNVVSRHQESRAWIYRPARSKAQFMAGELGQVLNEAGSDRCEVLAALVPTLDPSELGALASALDRAASSFRSGRRGPVPAGSPASPDEDAALVEESGKGADESTAPVVAAGLEGGAVPEAGRVPVVGAEPVDVDRG
ncbi:BlaI/MecI/CopY family transcriptional regulator [Acidipropionibacterium jensenii]|uniref:BlaI/MecI/CopY family transcriptional regulator n=1 Tax=Acidipropionibacterium jensenii TaxID=1749 RepID=UPI00110BB7B0|nr:BlaI/MecI/CopY family transcriptional regulator [Acidipropionibacterium jensenii]QCV87522.1 BlaI/MecI/CopY family transcriptional regulator [Acidipropionibacterium jensenii]